MLFAPQSCEAVLNPIGFNHGRQEISSVVSGACRKRAEMTTRQRQSREKAALKRPLLQVAIVHGIAGPANSRTEAMKASSEVLWTTLSG